MKVQKGNSERSVRIWGGMELILERNWKGEHGKNRTIGAL